MILFYSENINGDCLTLTPEDSLHCARVLRHRIGDDIFVTDGKGTMYECRITSEDPRRVTASVVTVRSGWNSHPYTLTAAVCPTKNNERFEWFIEKAVEIGVDRIVPLIGQRSERTVYKTDRARKLVISAGKQSLKSLFPTVCEPAGVKEFLQDFPGTPKGMSGNVLAPLRTPPQAGLIACCFEEESKPRISIKEALEASGADDITIMIGPEGDFSPEEASLAIEKGFIPVHLGPSRLRTETAAVVAVTMVYNQLGL